MFYNVIQGTEEWYQLRAGKVTASHFGTIMANAPNAFGNPAQVLAVRLAVERATGERIEEGYSNEWMEQGHENEPIARGLYELETFNTVDNGGIYIKDDYGSSPDGNVGADGQIEIKSVKYNTHFERIKKGGFDTKYQWQIQGNLWLSDREWSDFTSFCPVYPESKRLYIFRVYRDDKLIEQLQDRLEKFNNLVKSNLKLL